VRPDKMAEMFMPSEAAILPCGCRGPMLGHDDDFVQFGVESRGCDEHEEGEIVAVPRSVLLSPADSLDFWKPGL
jgi:hypothetical protein